MLTLNPLSFKTLAIEAAVIPLPRPDRTPPVTKMYFGFLTIRKYLQKL